jgi:O-succinylhomoserine sulfhydrylase
MLFAETPTNPLTDLCDIAALAELAHAHGALLAVDNSFATPVLQQPAKLGADLVVHSGTKFLDGQGRVMAGAVCGTVALVDKVMGTFLRSGGLNLAPFNAWVVMKGWKPWLCASRRKRAALELAAWLEAHPKVARVYYPGLASHPQHELAMRQQNGMGGAVLAFDVVGRAPSNCAPTPSMWWTARGVLHHRQPGRCEDHHHPPGQHLARPPDRRPAPGRRHRPGPDSHFRGPGAP